MFLSCISRDFRFQKVALPRRHLPLSGLTQTYQALTGLTWAQYAICGLILPQQALSPSQIYLRSSKNGLPQIIVRAPENNLKSIKETLQVNWELYKIFINIFSKIFRIYYYFLIFQLIFSKFAQFCLYFSQIIL